ncbi:MAG: N-6 DNA methylase [Acidimicrobiaceae bacterium]|nr:SAM-dependent methyltransferase [Acidimicrobiia bacterium]MCY4495352.1 N-6 DNA methylase [Acidimicrobiaceae bacterium]
MEATEPVPDQIQLADRLNNLHHLLYTRGGIRPSNAAVEELSKLLLLKIAAHRDPHTRVGDKRLTDLLDPDTVRVMADPQPLKEAFAVVNALPELGGQVPGGGTQSIWPRDEPLRISRCDVLAEALDILPHTGTGAEPPHDILGTAFDVFLRGRYEHAGGLGTYLTPDSVVKAMVKIGFDLIDPLDTEMPWPIMGDPCCGSGRFLIGLIEEAVSRNPDIRREQLRQAVVGADQSAASVAMARVNLLAYGISSPEVFTVEDSITAPPYDRLRGKMHLILTNPPFGESKYDSPSGITRTTKFFRGLRSKERIDPSLAFVARCVDLLAPNGVAGIILPDGVADGPHMREVLLEATGLSGEANDLSQEVSIDGIISLPSATFAPAGTTAKTSVLFLRKGARQSNQVFLARADHVGHIMKKGTKAVDPNGNDLPSIAHNIGQLLEGGSKNEGKVVSVDGTRLTRIDAATLDPEALIAERQLKAAGGKPFATLLVTKRRHRTKVQESVPFISVLHVDELGNVDWAKANRYRPTTPGIMARGEQIIVSLLNPAKFRATVIPHDLDRVHCSAEFGIYESSINPYATLALLQHRLVRAQIAPLGRGTSSSRRRIDADGVLELIAPPYQEDWVDKTGRVVRDSLEVVAEAKSRLSVAYNS